MLYFEIKLSINIIQLSLQTNLAQAPIGSYDILFDGYRQVFSVIEEKNVRFDFGFKQIYFAINIKK